MNYEQFDKKVRDASMQRAFPVEQETPDRFRQLLEQLADRTRDEASARKERPS